MPPDRDDDPFNAIRALLIVVLFAALIAAGAWIWIAVLRA